MIAAPRLANRAAPFVALNLLLLTAATAPGQVIQPPNPEQPGVPPSQERATLRGHKDVVTCLAYTHDGLQLASGSFDATVKIWNPATGQEKTTLKGLPAKTANAPASDNPDEAVFKANPARIFSVAFSPDGKTL